MIRSLEVKGLNNREDGNFKFDFHEDLNIFTGANGSGKTTLLKLLWCLISGHLELIISEIPFSFISIRTDSFSVTMDRQIPEELMLELNTPSKVIGQSVKIDPETNTISQKGFENVSELKKQIAEVSEGSLFFPSFRRIEGGYSIGLRSTAHTETVTEIRLLSSTTEKLLTAISQLSEDMSTEKHRFIFSVSTMDLVKLLPQKYVDVYQEINRIQSQVLANISNEIQNSPDKDNVGGTLKNATALLDAIQLVDKETEQLKKPISVLSDLTQKILRYNTIRVTDKLVLGETNEGLTFEERKDGKAIGEINNAISSDKLSSGEKQMLSFLCYNAFYENTSIFIDEPELSLHVDWQESLLPTLLQQATGNQFFVATHSPFIYTLYPDKEFMLSDIWGFQGEV